MTPRDGLAIRISDIEAARHDAELKHREAKANGYDDYEVGYWKGYEHAMADLIKKFGVPLLKDCRNER